jgi:hypothetical protein
MSKRPAPKSTHKEGAFWIEFAGSGIKPLLEKMRYIGNTQRLGIK